MVIRDLYFSIHALPSQHVKGRGLIGTRTIIFIKFNVQDSSVSIVVHGNSFKAASRTALYFVVGVVFAS